MSVPCFAKVEYQDCHLSSQDDLLSEVSLLELLQVLVLSCARNKDELTSDEEEEEDTFARNQVHALGLPLRGVRRQS